MNAQELALELLRLEEVPSPNRQARDAGVEVICIVIQYPDGVGVMRCLIGNVPTWAWRAIQGQYGYVERDSKDEGGASRIVFDGGNFLDSVAEADNA